MSSRIQRYFEEHLATVETLREQIDVIEQATQLGIEALGRGRKILLCGNGGSAADAQHIAAELVGRFVDDRRALPAVALTTDTSALTAIANDYGYEAVFERQVEALATAGDVLIGISTSGNSGNVLRACQKAAELGCQTIALAGKTGGQLKDVADLCLVVPSSTTAHIQECHILVGHLLCEGIESGLELA